MERIGAFLKKRLKRNLNLKKDADLKNFKK
jgi:hypothetical protein